MHSKKYQKTTQLVDKNKSYTLTEALELAKTTSKTKFDGSVELHCNLGIDPAKGDQAVRGNVTFPYGIGKSKRIVVFAGPNYEKDAEEAGADIVGTEQYISELASSSKIDFDVAIATPDMMPKLAKIAKILGPKGLMPNPKTETVTTDIKKTVAALKKGKLSFKNDSTGNVHQIVGKVSMAIPELLANLTALVEAIQKAKPSSSKGVYMKNCTLNCTMGPSIRISL